MDISFDDQLLATTSLRFDNEVINKNYYQLSALLNVLIFRSHYGNWIIFNFKLFKKLNLSTDITQLM